MSEELLSSLSFCSKCGNPILAHDDLRCPKASVLDVMNGLRRERDQMGDTLTAAQARNTQLVQRVRDLEEQLTDLAPTVNGLGKIIGKMNFNKYPLLPDPDLPQDVAFLAFVIDGERKHRKDAVRLLQNIMQYMGMTFNPDDSEGGVTGVAIEEAHSTSKRLLAAYQAAAEFLDTHYPEGKKSVLNEEDDQKSS